MKRNALRVGTEFPVGRFDYAVITPRGYDNVLSHIRFHTNQDESQRVATMNRQSNSVSVQTLDQVLVMLKGLEGPF